MIFNWQYSHDANGKAKRATHKRHNAIEGGEQNSHDEEANKRKDPYNDFYESATDRSGVGVVQVGTLLVEGLMDAGDDLEHVDDGPSVEGNLGERDDGDEGAHERRQGFGVTCGSENVGRDFIADAVAEHENSRHCGCGI